MFRWFNLIFILLCYFPIQVYSKKLPSWVSSPPSDTYEYYFSVGGGTTEELAKQSALEDVAGKLLTSVASTLEVRTQLSGSRVNEDTNSVIRSEISDTSISGYEVVGFFREKKKRHWALVKVKKDKLFQANWDEFRDFSNKLNLYFGENSIKNAIEIYQNASQLKRDISAARKKLFISAAIKNVPEFDRHLNYLNQYSDDSAFDFAVYIEAEDELKLFAYKLASLLSMEKNIKPLVGASQQGSPKLVLSGSVKEMASVMDENLTLARADITLSLYDENNQLASSNQKVISTTGFGKSARENLSNHFYDLVDQEGVTHYIGLTH